MPSAEQITQTVQGYLAALEKNSTDEIADLYTSDATVEDPVGGEVHIGRQAIHGFYAGIAGSKCSAEIVTLRVLGHEAAFYWTLDVRSGDGGVRLSIISTMTFDADAKITSMKAYWRPEDITPL